TLTGGRALIVSPLLLGDLYSEFRTVRLGKMGLFLQGRRHRAVPDLARVAVLVELEQLGGDRLAAVVPLAFVRIDVDFEGFGLRHAAASSSSAGPCGALD